jgi:hypothetical protein
MHTTERNCRGIQMLNEFIALEGKVLVRVHVRTNNYVSLSSFPPFLLRSAVLSNSPLLRILLH